MDVTRAAALIESGARIGVGGILAERRPVRLLAELGLSVRSELEVVALTTSIETDMLVAYGSVTRLRSSFASLGLYGVPPATAAARSAGTLAVPLETEMSIVAGLRAGIAGVGYLPMRAWDGTDFLTARPDVRTVTCPYTGEEDIAFPALTLDVALVHAPFADAGGRLALVSDPGIDVELLRAARTRVATVERVLSADHLDELVGALQIPAFDVDVVVVAPGGAYPTGCRPLYSPSWPAFAAWTAGGFRSPEGLLRASTRSVTQSAPQ